MDLQQYRFQVMWYATDDLSGFSAANSKAAGVREPYTVPEDGYIRLSIRDDSQSTLTDYSVSQYLVPDITGSASVASLREQVDVGIYATLDREAQGKGWNRLDTTTLGWLDGYGIGTDGSVTARNNRCAVDGYIACKAGSYVRLLDRRYRMAVCTYSGVVSSSKIRYTGYTDTDWIADTDCFMRVSLQRVAGPSISAETARDAVEIAAYNGGLSPCVHGSISTESGANMEATGQNRMRTSEGIFVMGGCSIQTPPGIPCFIREYRDRACTDYIGSYSESAVNAYTARYSCYLRFVFPIEDVYNLYASSVLTISGDNTEERRLYRTGKVFSPLDCLPVTHAPFPLYRYTGNIDASLLPTHPQVNRLTQIYAWFDELAESYPDCVSMSVLGMDATGTYEVRAYTIEAPKGTGSGTDARDEILWLSNIHGHEKYCLVSTYWLAREMLEHYWSDPHMAFLWANCRLVIVPAVNPWGVANGKRYNGNSVDLNRNFDADWTYFPDEGNGSSGGTSTEYLAEAETRLMKKLIRDHPKALFIVNRHDAGTLDGNGDAYAWTKDDFCIDRRIFEGVFRHLRTAWIDNHPWSKAGFVKGVIRNNATSSHAGTMDCWYNMIGKHGCLIETPNANWTDDGTTVSDNAVDSLRMSLEMNVNLLEAVVTWSNLIRAYDDISVVYTPSEQAEE